MDVLVTFLIFVLTAIAWVVFAFTGVLLGLVALVVPIRVLMSYVYGDPHHVTVGLVRTVVQLGVPFFLACAWLAARYGML